MFKSKKSYSYFILLLSFYSGLYGLVLELIWSRYLHLVFGVSIYAVSTVITCFMVGLATGNVLFGYICDKTRNHRKLLLILLFSIVVYGIISPWFYMGLQSLNYYVSVFYTPAGKQLFRIFISLLFLLIPTTLLGGIEVVLLRLYQSGIPTIGKSAAALYAANTIGSAMGAFITGFVLIRFCGLEASIWIATAVLLLLTFIFTRLIPSVGTSQIKKEIPVPAKTLPKNIVTVLLIVFGITGFTSMAYEVFWTRILVSFFRDTVYDFAIVLTTFLVGLFIGGLLSNKLHQKITNPIKVFVLIIMAIGISSIAGIFVVERLPYWTFNMQSMSQQYATYGDAYWLVSIVFRFAISSLLMLVPTILFGFTLPLITRLLVTNIETSGKKFGGLTGINTLGSTLGSLLAGFVLIDILGVQNSILFTAWLNIGSGIVLLVLCGAELIPNKWKIATAALGISVILVAIVPQWDKLRMSSNLLEPHQHVEELLDLKYYNEDATGIASVVQFKPTQQLFLSSGRLYIQNTSANKGFGDHRRLGYIPIFLHPNPQKVLAIGLGAGVTLSGIAGQQVPQIDCVEISKGISEAARYFATDNHHVLDQSNVHLKIEDGRNYIATTKTRYDVIVADIFFPMSEGSSDLFTTEYFSLCKNALQTNGTMCQWLPIHQFSLEGIKVVMKSFTHVFPYTSIWIGLADDAVPVIGLMGSDAPLSLSMAQLKQQFSRLDRNTLNEMELREPEELLSFFVCTDDECRSLYEDADLNTDNNPIIEFINPLIKDAYAESGRINLEAILSYQTDVSKRVK